MHIYCFGSVVRGEVTKDSDIDLLAICETEDSSFDPEKFQTSTYEKLKELWSAGTRFAWLLHNEAKLVYAKDERDFIRDLGSPAPYSTRQRDCLNFYTIFQEACDSLSAADGKSEASEIFDLSMIFFSIRSFAISYSMKDPEKAIFSRKAALRLGPKSLEIESRIFDIFNRARILSTRGIGSALSQKEIQIAADQAPKLNSWFESLIEEINNEK